MKDCQDFGFAYDENSGTPLQFDNDNDIASFRYIEPMTYWLPMAKSYPRTYDGAMQALAGRPANRRPRARSEWAQNHPPLRRLHTSRSTTSRCRTRPGATAPSSP